MPAIIPFLVTYGPSNSTWLVANRKELGETYGTLIEPILDKLHTGTTIDRVGPVLAEIHGGQARAIGLLHQHTRQLHDASAAADVLTWVSSVGLGVSVLSHVHLAWQFRRLAKQLRGIQSDVQQLKGMALANLQGKLDAGLTHLKNAIEVKRTDPELSRATLNAATAALTTVAAQYLANLQSPVARHNPRVAALFAQNMLLATLGDVAVKIEQHQPNLAVQALQGVQSALVTRARSVLDRTVLDKPTLFLAPGLARHGVTLDALTELYRQAHHARVIDNGKHLTAAELFEVLRDRLSTASDPRFGAAGKLQRLHGEFLEARDAVEQVNQVQGLVLLIRGFDRPNRSVSGLADQVRHLIEARQPGEGSCFAAFPDPAAAGYDPD